jgi:hypothetical protein
MNINNDRSIRRAPARYGRKDKEILSSVSLMVTLSTGVYIYSYFNSRMALYFGLLFSGQLRADYVRSQMYRGQVLV